MHTHFDTHVKKALHIWKETYIHQKRPAKETYIHDNRRWFTHECVASRMNKSCHTWIPLSRETRRRSASYAVDRRRSASYAVDRRRSASYAVDSGSCHTWMRPVTHMNESRHTWTAWQAKHGAAARVIASESCHTCMRHITYEWFTSHMTTFNRRNKAPQREQSLPFSHI